VSCLDVRRHRVWDGVAVVPAKRHEPRQIGDTADVVAMPVGRHIVIDPVDAQLARGASDAAGVPIARKA
jgi:hypothetical protein